MPIIEYTTCSLWLLYNSTNLVKCRVKEILTNTATGVISKRRTKDLSPYTVPNDLFVHVDQRIYF